MYNIAKLLIAPERKNIFEQTPLHFAVRIGDINLTNRLIQKGANVNSMDVFENTPLSLACIEVPNRTIVKLLLLKGADINFKRQIHMPLFLECVISCKTQEQMDIINLLIDNGVNINMTDRITNRSCMHLVAFSGNVSLAKLLVERGAVVNIRDNFNSTPIQIAKNHGHDELVYYFSVLLAEI